MATAIPPRSTPSVERESWPEAVRRMDWRQGEHVTLIAPTGRGKTELTVQLLEHRRWVVFLATKRIDSTSAQLHKKGYRTIRTADELNPDLSSKFILHPPFPRVSAAQLRAQHREAFREGLMRAFRQTGWTVSVDEARYICDYLGLKDEMMLLWLQGRSQGNSVICSTQRSRFVPLEAYDQATHLFMWTDPDVGNINRNSELAGFNRNRVIRAMRSMNKHDVLYVNTVTNEMFITNTRWR